MTAVVSAEVDTAIIWVVDAAGGLVTPETATLSESEATMALGTVKVTLELELARVGAAVTVPLPLEWVESVIT